MLLTELKVSRRFLLMLDFHLTDLTVQRMATDLNPQHAILLQLQKVHTVREAVFIYLFIVDQKPY